MIDFHSHILPAVDDGSKNIDESLKMLSMLREQGIDTVVSTSHYQAQKESVDEFIARRNKAFDELMSRGDASLPKILLGAEIEFYDGISRLENLHKLKIGDSRLLLVEMPMNKWTEHTIKEIERLAFTNEYVVVLAHIERFLSYQTKESMERLMDASILFQVNASYFNDFFTRRKAMNMLRNNAVHFIGSDCHNLTSRAPAIGKAYDLIKSKMGASFISDYTDFHREMLSL